MRKALSGPGRGDGRHTFCYACDSAHVDAALGGGRGSLSRTASGDADDHDESCGLSADAGKERAGERFAILDRGDAAQDGSATRGSFFSDDLEMGGILKFLPVEDAAVAAIRAGSDLLEICHSPELILRTYEALVSEGERSAAFRKLLLATARDLRASGLVCMREAWRLRWVRRSWKRCARAFWISMRRWPRS